MTDYPKPGLTADAVVLAGQGPDTSLLVIERGRPPFRGMLALPGGFVDPFEQPLAAAVRELLEETGLPVSQGRAAPLDLRAKKGRDPRGWNISQPYLFWVAERISVQAGDDARRAFWVPLKELDRLAFDHGAILCEAISKLWPCMPTHDPLFEGVHGFGVPRCFPEEVTFYGGTFNPWHEGHATCVSLCPNREGLVVVPDTSPFKAELGEGCFWQKYRAVQSNLSEFPCHVFPGYFGRERPNPTVHWLPHTGFGRKGLLIGDDNFAIFEKWRDADTLADSLDHLYVVPRDAPPNALAAARRWFRERHPRCRITMLADHPYRDISSTKRRKQSL